MTIAELSLCVVTEALSNPSYEFLKKEAKAKGYKSPEHMVDASTKKVRGVLTGGLAASGAYKALTRDIDMGNDRLNMAAKIGLPIAGAAMGYGVGSLYRKVDQKLLQRMKNQR